MTIIFFVEYLPHLLSLIPYYIYARRGNFTQPIVFAGKTLSVNFATSAAGSMWVELQTADGKPIKGFALADSVELFGDTLDRKVTWKQGADVSALAGKPVRLQFKLKDADLYSFQFQK